MTEFHIQQVAPCLPHWPNGAWSVYEITGDQIADRVVREAIDPRGFYTGKVVARHSWCGYVGMFETFEEACGAMRDVIAPQDYVRAIPYSEAHPHSKIAKTKRRR